MISENYYEIRVEVKNKDREPIKSAHVILETSPYLGREITRCMTNEDGKCTLKIPQEYGRDFKTNQFFLRVTHQRYEAYEDSWVSVKHKGILVIMEECKKYRHDKVARGTQGESYKWKDDTKKLIDTSTTQNPVEVKRQEDFSAQNYHEGRKIVEPEEDKETNFQISRKVGRLLFNVTDNNRRIPGIEIAIGDNTLTTDSNGVARVELPLDTYQAIIKDPHGIYKGEELSVDIVDNSTTKNITLKGLSPEMDFSQLSSELSALENQITSSISEASYDQFIPKYLLTMCQTFYTLGEKYKENISLLRDRYDKQQISEHLNGIDEVSSAVCEKVKNLLTTRESLYILYDIKRFKGPMQDDINLDTESMAKKAIEKELNGSLGQEISSLSRNIDESITQAMRNTNVYYFSTLYKITKDVNSNHANPVIYIVLETIRTMLEDENVKERLRGIRG